MLWLCLRQAKENLLQFVAIRQETKNKKLFLKGLYKFGEVPKAANSTIF